MTPDRDVLLVFLAARAGCEAGLAEVLTAQRRRWSGHGAVEAFVRLPDDPFRSFTPGMRGFDATLELCAPLDVCRAAVADLEHFDVAAQRDLSAVVFGREREFVPGGPGPVRYQYLMRRRHDFDHARYLAHYGTVHADIGTRTAGKLGYSQVHVDLDASRALAREAGMGVWQIDSVSRLWLDSVDAFLAAAGAEGQEAIADERNFVDGANSVMFASAALA